MSIYGNKESRDSIPSMRAVSQRNLGKSNATITPIKSKRVASNVTANLEKSGKLSVVYSSSWDEDQESGNQINKISRYLANLHLVNPKILNSYLKLLKTNQFERLDDLCDQNPDLNLAVDSLPTEYKEFLNSQKLKSQPWPKWSRTSRNASKR